MYTLRTFWIRRASSFTSLKCCRGELFVLFIYFIPIRCLLFVRNRSHEKLGELSQFSITWQPKYPTLLYIIIFHPFSCLQISLMMFIQNTGVLKSAQSDFFNRLPRNRTMGYRIINVFFIQSI